MRRVGARSEAKSEATENSNVNSRGLSPPSRSSPSSTLVEDAPSVSFSPAFFLSSRLLSTLTMPPTSTSMARYALTSPTFAMLIALLPMSSDAASIFSASSTPETCPLDVFIELLGNTDEGG